MDTKCIMIVGVGGQGTLLTSRILGDALIAQGAHNLNLVNPTHYAERLARVLRDYRSPVPVVYNSSGYESVETLKKLEGLVDVYLPDFKFSRPDRALQYAGAADYPAVAALAIEEMKRQQPADVFENGLMQKGVIVRHLILPKNTNASIEVLQTIADRFGTETIVSLMAQYTPCGEIDRFPELQRPVFLSVLPLQLHKKFRSHSRLIQPRG